MPAPGTRARIALPGSQRWLAAGACLVPVALGFLIPLAYLVHEVIARGLLVGFDPALSRTRTQHGAARGAAPPC